VYVAPVSDPAAPIADANLNLDQPDGSSSARAAEWIYAARNALGH
jgi:hypothetical protein